MINFKEWKAKNEATALPVSLETEMPTADDWYYYKTKIQGRMKYLLDRFTDEVSKKQLNLIRKGFIVQEVLDALGMDMGQFIRIMNNVKRSMQKHLRNEQRPLNTPAPPTFVAKP